MCWVVSCCKAFTIRDTLKLVRSSRLTRYRIMTKYVFAANKMKVVYTEQANQKVMLALLLTFWTWKHKTIILLCIYCLLFILLFIIILFSYMKCKIEIEFKCALIAEQHVCVCAFLHTCIKYLLLCSKSFWWLIWSVKWCYRTEAWSFTRIYIYVTIKVWIYLMKLKYIEWKVEYTEWKSEYI